jgi:hypothetical protein
MVESLHSHLSEYTRKYKELRGLGHKCKYLNLIVLTSRDPGNLDGFDDSVLDYARQLDELHAPKFQLSIQFALIQSCYDMEVGENHVRVFYGTEKREGEKLEIYTGGIGPCSNTVYQTCNMSPAQVHL